VNAVKMPRLNKTGEYALMELSMRQSRSQSNRMNVRLSLPRRSMYVTIDGEVEMLPQSQSSTGHILAQFPLSLQ